MNVLKVILLLFLILKSTGGFALPLSCCEEVPAESTEISTNDDQEEEKNCCGNGECGCLCCACVFTIEATHKISFESPNYTNTINVHYVNRLSRIYDNALWQPPRNS